ncbi:hypothetical protein NDU88_003047 [Pleurodeles waltl]|uniref:Uncharacterized protein n=1 Tax=Pleurodeles waltl TaxID=8319 RepID=A0AAV7M3E7_PLEWA|nr:hypothetical protein NDU88_003047 [Pleurodeles waltl]
MRTPHATIGNEAVPTRCPQCLPDLTLLLQTSAVGARPFIGARQMPRFSSEVRGSSVIRSLFLSVPSGEGRRRSNSGLACGDSAHICSAPTVERPTATALTSEPLRE